MAQGVINGFEWAKSKWHREVTSPKIASMGFRLVR
jgi:hypothetical protein